MSLVARRLVAFLTAVVLLAAAATGAIAEKKYDADARDTKIKIGNIMPYSGPLSVNGVIGRTEAMYFRRINDEGGINGRKNTSSLDFAPIKQVRLRRFKGETWELFGPMFNGEVGDHSAE